jgi:hypothetical protein
MEWREPTAQEQALIEHLLSAEFSGRDAIRRQLQSAMVRVIDKEGSLGFLVPCAERATVKYSIPIEAEADDIDGTTIHMLLHVRDGFIAELEFYKDDSSRIVRRPPTAQWRVVNLHD